MFDSRRQKELRDLTALAIRRHEKIEAMLALRTSGPLPGDLYVFPVPGDLALQWAVVLQHPENDELVYTVPADDHPFAGTADVRVPQDAESEPLVLRCGLGLWLHEQDFLGQQRSGVIPESSVTRTRQILSRMLTADLDGSALQAETVCDPEYESWMREVSSAVEALRTSFAQSEAPAVVVSLVSFQTRWPQRLLDKLDVGTEFALAAAPSGLLGKVHEQLRNIPSDPPAHHLIRRDLPGDLIACQEADGIALIYVPKTDDRPPRAHAVSESDWKLLDWQRSPNGTLYRAFPPLNWQNDQVELDVTAVGRVTITRNDR